MIPAHRASAAELDVASSDPDLAAARGGDEAAFARLTRPLTGELRAHCYRMLGSFHDAEDAVQESLLRAWKGLARFEGRSSLRSWLYTVATRVCLDAVASRQRRELPMDLGPAADRAVLFSEPLTDVAWLTPYPDAQPERRSERREAIELAFVATLQHLPGNQRAVLLLFDVLDFSAAEIAEIMATSVVAVNSALARARRVLADRAPTAESARASTFDDEVARAIAARFATALEEGDIDTFVSMLVEDVTWSMPPLAHWYRGIAAVSDFALRVPMSLCPSWRHRMTRANGQSAIAFYVGEEAAGSHEAWSITVLELRGDRIAGITSFLGPELFDAFAMPRSLSNPAHQEARNVVATA